jgi:hypothetical protein
VHYPDANEPSSGIEGDNSSYSPPVSFAGRLVAIDSMSTNLVPNDTNFTPDVYVRDRQAGTTTLVSADSNGVGGDNLSFFSSISGDGHVGTSQSPAAGDPLASVRRACNAGDFRTYQVWYRNAAAFCTPSTFNLTNGVMLTWVP